MKNIIIASVALAAITATAAVTQRATAPSGTDNVAFGYGAGYGSSGSNVNVVVIGTEAGRATSWNTNCVYIGASAGQGRSGKEGEVIIGDVLYHTNGVTTIKGFSGGGSGFNTNGTNYVTSDFKLYLGSEFALEYRSGFHQTEWYLNGSCNYAITSGVSSVAESASTLRNYTSPSYGEINIDDSGVMFTRDGIYSRIPFATGINVMSYNSSTRTISFFDENFSLLGTITLTAPANQ